jgi:hypothetical protein
MVRLSDGTLVHDVSPAQSPMMAGEDMAPNRLAYLESLKVYATFPMHDVRPDPRDIASDIRPVLVERLKENSSWSATFAKMSPAKIDDLALRISVVLAVTAGLPRSDFEPYVKGYAWAAPSNIPADDRDQSKLPPDLFATLYDHSAAMSSEGVIAAASFDAKGMRVALGELPISMIFGMLNDVMNEKDTPHFYGYARDCWPMFHVHPNLAQLERNDQKVLAFEMSMVVQDKSGDRFPLWMTFFYDEMAESWYCYHVCRNVSPIAIGRRVFVY